MKRSIVSTILVLTLLALTAGVAIAIWEDTKSTQVTATILPLPENTFHIVSSNCVDAVVGYDGHCFVNIANDSPTSILVGDIDMEVTTTYSAVTTQIVCTHPTHKITPGESWQLMFTYSAEDPACEPGEVTFDVEVTCSGE